MAAPLGSPGELAMNKQDLVAVVADAGDISKAKAGEVVDAIFTAIEDPNAARLEKWLAELDEGKARS